VLATRPLGRTGHLSSVAILGCCAFADGDAAAAAVAVRDAVARGVNHLDVAPSYGRAESAIAPVLAELRQQVFLAGKTMERSRAGARAELEGSLARLGVDRFDLYQLHAVTSERELETALHPGGALEAILEARDEGLTRFVGITGHFLEAPRVFSHAVAEAPFDTVMFPLGAGHLTDPRYRRAAEQLLERCADADIGVMAIKALARRPWPDDRRPYSTWYEPIEDPAEAERAVAFTLSFPIAGFATPCDRRLLPLALAAAEAAVPMTPEERTRYLAEVTAEPLPAMP